MKHIIVKILLPYAGLSVGSILTMTEFSALPHPIQGMDIDKLIAFLKDNNCISLIYPKYFVGVEGNEVLVYRRTSCRMQVNYICPKSLSLACFSMLVKSDYVSVFTDEALKTLLNEIKNKKEVCLEGQALKVGQLIHMIDISNGASIDVHYYDGLMDKYPNTQYLFFLSAGERNNAAYRMNNGTFVQDDDFRASTFTGEEIMAAMRQNDHYIDNDEYWGNAIAIIDKLKQGRKT